MEKLRYNVLEKETSHFDFVARPTIPETTESLLNRLFSYGEKVFLLHGTGFNMINQINQWVNEFNIYDPKSKRILVEKIMSDVTGFYHEYLSRRDIFPFDLEFKTDSGGEKIVYASKYHQSLENITDDNERDGKLLEGIKMAIEIMKSAEPNTVVFLTSPSGWSGLLAGEHPDSQTYVYWITQNGDLNATTLRTDIDLLSSEKLVGINAKNISTRERIKDIVSTPVKIEVVEDGFIEVLDAIEEASKQKFPKIRSEIENRDLYKSLTGEEDVEIKLILDQLQEFITNEINGNNDETIKSLAMAIGKSILDMQHAVNKRVNKFNDQTHVVAGFDSPDVKYQVLHHEVKQILGCNNGLQEQQRGFGFDSKGPLDFNCPSCNKKNTRPYGQLISNCQHCGADVRC